MALTGSVRRAETGTRSADNTATLGNSAGDSQAGLSSSGLGMSVLGMSGLGSPADSPVGGLVTGTSAAVRARRFLRSSGGKALSTVHSSRRST